jgi:hypothetical protein
MTIYSAPQHEQVTEKRHPFVTPAKAGVQKSKERLDSRFRGNDSKDGKSRFFNIP